MPLLENSVARSSCSRSPRNSGGKGEGLGIDARVRALPLWGRRSAKDRLIVEEKRSDFK